MFFYQPLQNVPPPDQRTPTGSSSTPTPTASRRSTPKRRSPWRPWACAPACNPTSSRRDWSSPRDGVSRVRLLHNVESLPCSPLQKNKSRLISADDTVKILRDAPLKIGGSDWSRRPFPLAGQPRDNVFLFSEAERGWEQVFVGSRNLN